MTTAHETHDLELGIRPDKAGYVVGEAIFLDISLRNVGSQVVKVPTYFIVPADDPDKNNLEIRVYDANGNRLSRVSDVLTGRLLYHPQIYEIDPGQAYRDSVQVAGTFTQSQRRKKIGQPLWSLGEDPELTATEYPPVTPGTFKLQVAYHVTQRHLISLSEAERSTVWQGQLTSNIIEISIV